jgi:hypothetical protein
MVVPIQAAQVLLTWNDFHNDPAEVGGYTVYYWQAHWDIAADVNVGDQTTYTLTGLVPGQTYYFAVTAHDGNGGRESAFSHEVAYTLLAGNENRITAGQVVLYTFAEGSGTTVYDVSGVGIPLDLTVADATAVTWLAGGGLALNAPTVVESVEAATKVSEAVRASNELTVEAWIKPTHTTQTGLACIVTLSQDLYARNVTLGQGLWEGQLSALYDVRLRTTATSTNGMPSLSTPDGMLSPELSHVVYTRNAAGEARLYLDGVEVASGMVGGDTSIWNIDYRLALGSELTADPWTGWLGEFHLVALYDRALSADEVDQNYTAGIPRGQ